MQSVVVVVEGGSRRVAVMGWVRKLEIGTRQGSGKEVCWSSKEVTSRERLQEAN